MKKKGNKNQCKRNYSALSFHEIHIRYSLTKLRDKMNTETMNIQTWKPLKIIQTVENVACDKF